MANQISAGRGAVKRGRGRPPVGEARRAQIADGLLRIMGKTGYAKATVAEIARAAKVSTALVHHHFGGKHAVLVALVGRLTSALEARLAARLTLAGADPHRRLEAFVDAHVALGPDANRRAVAAWVVIGA